tara:strand:- start:173954 stop:174748 length:795 start_codon:yes stop_codon:yes gene_type:complete
MKTEHVSALLPDYLDNNLDQNRREIVEIHLKGCDSCQKELEELRQLFTAFKTEPQEEVPASVSANFYAMLEEEKAKQTNIISLKAKSKPAQHWIPEFLKIAAAIALIIGAYFFGKNQEQTATHQTIASLETKNEGFKQTAMLSLMENQSASKRIQGVNYIDQFSKPDEAIMQALIDRMLHDENTNVRLTATEALEKFTTSEQVKNAFITALEQETDPGIQIKIIQILVKIQEKKAVKPMQRLLETDNTQPFVKDQIKSLMPGML